MTWALHTRFLRVSVAGAVVRTTADVSVSESLDQLVRTASFVMAAQPDPRPAQGDAVLIELVSADESTVWPLFAGTINSLDVESEPWAYSVLACDQLEKLRATKKSGDLDLTGMTDGEAWKAIADYCAVAYDDADVADAGYLLGGHEPLAWHDDASGSGGSVIAELDGVFGMATMTVGADRVIRIPVDYTPSDDTGLYATYQKGVNADWSAHHRAVGDRDAIQNVWRVTGVNYETSNGSCTSTPWAFSVSGNAQIGRRVRTAEQTFSSDFVQDESLAEAIVRRLMRRFNRGPDRASLTLELDANLHPGHKVKLVDHTYGINTGAGRRCLVTAVSRAGLQMTADCECGSAGAEGTVTHGVDKVCNDAHTDVNWDDGFTPPAFDYPPLDAGDPITWDPPTAGWDVGIPHPDDGCVPPAAAEGCTDTAWTTGVSIEAGADWEITGTLTLNDAADGLTLGLDTDDGFYRFRIAGGGFYDPLVGAFRYELLTPTQSRRLAGYAALDTAIDWTLKWEDALTRLTFYADVGTDICYSDVVIEPAATMATALTWESVAGTPTRASESIAHGCTGGGGGGGGGGECIAPDAPDWDTVSGSISYAGGEVDLALDTSPTAHLTGAHVPVNAPTRVSMSGTVAFSGAGTPGVDTPFFTAALASGGFFAGMQVTWDPDSGDGHLYATGFVSGFADTAVPASYLAAGFPFSVACDPDTDTVTVQIGDGDYTATTTMDSWTDATVEISGASTSAIDATVTELSLCFFASGTTDDLLGILADWVEIDPTLTTHVGGEVETDVQGAGYNSAHVIDPASDFSIAATLQIKGGASDHDVSIGIGTTGGTLEYGVNLLSTDRGYAYTANANAFLSGSPFADDADVDVAIVWNAGARTLLVRATQGATTVDWVVFDGGALPGFPLSLMVASAGTPLDTAGIDVTALMVELP